MGPKQHNIGHRSLFTLEWDDEELEFSENTKLKINAHNILESRHDRNGRRIRPLMQTLPYSLVKQNSSSPSKLYPDPSSHTTYIRIPQNLQSSGLSDNKTGEYELQTF